MAGHLAERHPELIRREIDLLEPEEYVELAQDCPRSLFYEGGKKAKRIKIGKLQINS